MTLPAIATFHSANAPAETCWIARYRDGRTGYLPMVFHAATQEMVERAAVDWWTAEQRKLSARVERLANARAARKKRAA